MKNDLPAMELEILAAMAAISQDIAEHGSTTYARQLRYFGTPYGVAGRAFRAMQAAGQVKRNGLEMVAGGRK